MFTISRKVSFSVVIAMLLGWGVMSILIFQSSQVLLATDYAQEAQAPLPSGVKLAMVVDKKVYQPEEKILISLRNDSRKQIWLAKAAGGCPNSWWFVQRQEGDVNNWQTVPRTSVGCAADSSGLEKFPSHTLKTDSWDGLLQTGDLGEVFDKAPTGTYRITVSYLVGKEVKEADWKFGEKLVSSASFTIQ